MVKSIDRFRLNGQLEDDRAVGGGALLETVGSQGVPLEGVFWLCSTTLRQGQTTMDYIRPFHL